MRKNVLSQILLVAIFLGIIVIIVGVVLLSRQTTRIAEALGVEALEVKALETGQIAGHGYVDLGLSVKWATCNVGASRPSDYGNYYAWGETETKSEYTYDNSVTYLKRMGSIAGNPQYDAATANWGGTWRMPTYEEMGELIDKCNWKWAEMEGHKGYEVTGPNGRSIFLPAARWRYGSSLYRVGKYGYYWSATPHEDYAYCAYGLGFDEGDFYRDRDFRDGGQSVRPVSD